jgi:hypothetical protein
MAANAAAIAKRYGLGMGGNPERDRGENSADGLPGKRVPTFLTPL